ncbi:MAG: MFS transporter [Candidatus Magasanikbacteria bacterium]|nr:MFS transporter [Candidatus Magasanikbacteria bacterium]
MTKQKLTIAFTVLMDVVGLGIVLPSLPFYIARFGGSAIEITYLFAAYAACSFLSTPMLGALSDRIGRRPVLMASIGSTALGWIVFASANSLPLLFLGRMIDGLAAGNFSTAQSYLVDISKDEVDRTHNLGMIGALFGIGFIIGPMLGGLLGAISPSLPFWTAGGLAVLNFIAAYFFLKETHHVRNTDKMYINPFRPIARAWANKQLLPYFIVWFLFGLAVAGVFSVNSIYFADRFGFNAFTIGVIMAVQGVIMALNQMVGLKRFWLKRFKEPQLVLIMLFIFGLAYSLMGMVYTGLFFLGVLFSVFAQSVLRAVFTSEVIGMVDPKIKGEVMGILGSVMSLGMVVGPLIIGPIYSYKNNLSFVASGFYMFVAFAIIYRHRKKMENIVPDEQAQVNVL